MRGTLSEADTTWALVETNDGSVYRMGAGEYLGLFNGRISKVTSQNGRSSRINSRMVLVVGLKGQAI